MIEQHAVEFGGFAKDYAEAAEKIGISKEGVFLLTAYADLKRDGKIDEDEITAQEMLLNVADWVEEGVPEANKQEVAELLRYLAQFTLQRPVPVE